MLHIVLTRKSLSPKEMKSPRRVFFQPGYDVAVLRLKSSIRFSETVKPVCLPSGELDTARGQCLELSKYGLKGLKTTVVKKKTRQ